MARTERQAADMTRKAFYGALDGILGDFVHGHWGFEYKYLELKRGAGWSKLTILYGSCRVHIYIAEKGVTFVATTPVNMTRRQLAWYEWQDGDDHNMVLEDFRTALDRIYERLSTRPKWVLMSGMAWPFKAWPRPEPVVQPEDKLTPEERREHIEALFGNGEENDMRRDDTRGGDKPRRKRGLWGRRRQAEPDGISPGPDGTGAAVGRHDAPDEASGVSFPEPDMQAQAELAEESRDVPVWDGFDDGLAGDGDDVIPAADGGAVVPDAEPPAEEPPAEEPVPYGAPMENAAVDGDDCVMAGQAVGDGSAEADEVPDVSVFAGDTRAGDGPETECADSDGQDREDGGPDASVPDGDDKSRGAKRNPPKGGQSRKRRRRKKEKKSGGCQA